MSLTIEERIALGLKANPEYCTHTKVIINESQYDPIKQEPVYIAQCLQCKEFIQSDLKDYKHNNRMHGNWLIYEYSR